MAKELTAEQTQRIAAALAEGRKIEAIKLYREVTGEGLKESKEFIDALVPKLVAQDPVKYAKAAQGGGCAGAVLLAAATAVAAALALTA
jgi:ribosomal protein L7/L12